MERLRPKVLILGENIYSAFLSSLLVQDNIESFILSPNRSAMLINPIYRYYNDVFCQKENGSDRIKDFLQRISLSYSEDFGPLETLYITDDIIKCSAVYNSYNYYEESKKNNSRITFINIENLQDSFIPLLKESQKSDSIKIRILKKDRIYSLYELASILENDREALKTIADEINKSSNTSNSILVFPPVLGISGEDKIRSFLSELTQKKTFEALTFSTAVVSKRFYGILSGYLKGHKVNVIYEKIEKIETEHKFIKSVQTKNYCIEPEIVILITERFVEEGLTIRENKVVEPFLGLPVFFTRKKNEISYFTDEDIFGQHNIFSCGIKVNENYIPIDIFGNTVLENLYAAGSIILNNRDALSNLLKTFRLYTIIKEKFCK